MYKAPVVILMPIETIARELDARLVLASLYGQRHHRILLTSSTYAHELVSQVKGGLYVGKHIMYPTAANPTSYYRAKENGTKLVHLAEEGGIFMGDEASWRVDLDMQLDPKVLSADDWVCTWGAFQRDHYLSRGAKPGRVVATGHPRFDIYKQSLRALYADDAEALRRRFGRFVLFNSNLTWAVDAEGPWNTFNPEQGYTPDDDEGRLRFIGRWGRQVRTLPEFVELIHKLATRRRDVNFVVRPHPSDNLVFFRYAFNGVPNIHVVREGTVAPWLMASAVMLHDGCTTGIEAHLLGCRIVNFSPVTDEHEAFLPNLLGTRARTQSQAMEAILNALDDPPGADRWQPSRLPEAAHRVFANFEGDSVGSFLSVLNEAEGELKGDSSAPTAAALLTDQARAIAVEEAKHLVRRVAFHRRYLTAMHGRARFPGFDRATIRKKLDTLAKLTGRQVDSRWLSPNVVELQPASEHPLEWPKLPTTS